MQEVNSGGFALALSLYCLSLGLGNREELGAGKNQWTCRHNGFVTVCSGRLSDMKSNVAGWQKNTFFR